MPVEIPITNSTLQEMFQYAYYAKKHFNAEIAGWGHYNPKHGIYKLAPLTPQTVEGSEVNNFPNDILNDTKYDISDMIVQWHSHVDGACTPSGETGDIGNIRKTLKLISPLISIIVNCKGEYSARLDFNVVGNHNKIHLPMTTVDVRLKPYFNDLAVEKEVLKKCSKPKVVPITPVQSNYVGSGITPSVNVAKRETQEEIVAILDEIGTLLGDMTDSYESFYIYQMMDKTNLTILKYDKLQDNLTVNNTSYYHKGSTIRMFLEKLGVLSIIPPELLIRIDKL